MKIEFNVPGTPKGKGRPQFARKGKIVVTRTPESTVSYEELIRWCWKTQSGRQFPDDTALKVAIHCYFPIAKSLSKKKRFALIGKPHTSRPDCDNIAKTIIDALNRLAFYDDSAICELRITKMYSESPCVDVRIEEA